MMLFGGQKDGANAACFIQIKKSPVPNRVWTPAAVPLHLMSVKLSFRIFKSYQ
jgi:hypothetical protein